MLYIILINHLWSKSQSIICKSGWAGARFLPLRGERCRWRVPTDTITVTLQETAQVCKRALFQIHTKRPVPSHQLPASTQTHIDNSHSVLSRKQSNRTAVNNGKCKCDCINTLAVEQIRGLICITNIRMVPFPVDSNSGKSGKGGFLFHLHYP